MKVVLAIVIVAVMLTGAVQFVKGIQGSMAKVTVALNTTDK